MLLILFVYFYIVPSSETILLGKKSIHSFEIGCSIRRARYKVSQILNLEILKKYALYQRFVSSIGNIEKALWVFNCLGRWAKLGSQKLFFKLTSIFPQKIHDNFQLEIQKITQIRKSWAPSFSNQKRNVCFSQWLRMFIVHEWES